MSFTHSIMFHHFHSDIHLPSQGSLSGSDFSEMLDWLSDKHNLISANEYFEKFMRSSLCEEDICLSFDDALLCQYDIALPVLEDRGLSAFFFVYSSVYSNDPDKLEIFRYFRTNAFSKMDDFYKEFFYLAESYYGDELNDHRKIYSPKKYLTGFPFYSENDRWFRYIRDRVLGSDRYNDLMCYMMKEKGFSPNSIIKNLWMSEEHLKDLANRGHLVGLHSYSHPTQMSALNYRDQYSQYKKNLDHLREIVGRVECMSHPCGDYNKETLLILEDLGVKIGFRSNLSEKSIKGVFEVPRNDHANVYKDMAQ